MTVARRIEESLRALGEREILRLGGESFSAERLLLESGAIARALSWHEVGQGEVVAIHLGTGLDFVRVLLGTLRAGAVSLPLNPSYSAAELAPLLARAAPRLVVVERRDRCKIEAALVEAGGRTEILEKELLPATLAAGLRAPAQERPAIIAETPALLVATSGTTGQPKLALHSQGSLLAGIAAIEAAWGLEAADHLLLCLPLFHVHGLVLGLLGSLAVGHRTTLLERFEVETVLTGLAECGAEKTLYYGVPTHYHRLLQAPEFPAGLDRMRLWVSGSAPLPAALHEAFLARFGKAVLERYGMTETLMIASNPLTGTRRAGTVGQALPGVEIAIVGDDDEPLPVGREGEIRLRGTALFAGYWRNPEATAASFDRSRRFRSGDVGWIDPATGYLTISGRSKEMIASGGMKVFPREIEDFLTSCDAVAEAAVLGRPDADLGERVEAAVVPAAGATLDLEALGRALRERLAPYKRPKAIRVLAALPRNALGKIDRRRLAEEWIDERR